ncbi:MAG: hypothetical protein ACXWKR_07715, partial [Phenylobacterium sp.]
MATSGQKMSGLGGSMVGVKSWCVALAVASAPVAALAQAQPQTSAPADLAKPAAAPAPPAKPAPAKPSGQAKPSTKTVEAITVVGAAPDVQTSIDKQSYTLGKDLLATTGSVADALRNLPAVEVDLQGN